MTTALRPSAALRAIGDTLGSAAGGPAWQEFRRAALARLTTLGLPTPRDDGFKYANLRLLERRDLRPAVAATDGSDPPAVDGTATVGPGAHTVVVGASGVITADAAALARDGIELVPLAVLVANGSPESAGLTLPGDQPDERLRLWAAAVAGTGLTVRLAAGARPERPLHLVYTTRAGAHYPRLALSLGTGASLLLIEEHRAPIGGKATTLAVSDLALAANAHLSHVRLDDAASDLVLLDDARVEVGPSAGYEHRSFGLRAGLSRLDLRVDLKGAGAAADLTGLLVADEGRAAHVRTVVRHEAQDTRSTQTYRAIAGGGARASYDGKVIVSATARGASSRQSSRNLLLAADAEIDTRPQLEIHTDEVTASHGATTGTLDMDMLFYLRSRGIDEATARGLLTYAFAADVIRGVPVTPLRALLGARIIGLLPDAALLKDFIA